MVDVRSIGLARNASGGNLLQVGVFRCWAEIGVELDWDVHLSSENPHPGPLPEGEGEEMVPPSPSGRGAGGEGRSTFGVPFALRNILHFTGGGEASIGWQRLPTAIGVPQAQDAAVSAVPADEALLVEERTNCGFLRASPAPIAGGNRGYPVPISSSVAAARIPPWPSGRGVGDEGRSTFGVPFVLRNILHFIGGGK
ncbi:hypothetical protein Mal52_56230 [Symmachiella dynata]|uniref:Uncharacterized protein n=1 Tax=Symmachiella dynata TaxID=2527995 RepID=A0A517ZXC9_9PLAN|nr:hypothetical protein Mal52_56230 [Symmachiella dynata]